MVKERMQFDIKFASIIAGFAISAILAQAAGPQAVAMGSHAGAQRVIEDPHSGRRWVLKKDQQHPGGPGTLVELQTGEGVGSGETQKAPLVIRSGDRVLVEEDTRIARGVFDAVALSTARKGMIFRVRLRVGGRVVRAIATGPGRAMLAGADEVGQ